MFGEGSYTWDGEGSYITCFRNVNSMPIELIIQWVAFIYSDNKKAKYASNLSKITRSIEEAECNIAVSSL